MSILFRVLLLIANAVFLAYFANLLSTKSPRGSDWWLLYGIVTFLAFNIAYLFLHGKFQFGRVSRLIGLWFDAKEAELRDRAVRSKEDK